MQRNHPPTTVADVMTAALITVRPTAHAADVLRTMRRLGIEYLIVEPQRPGSPPALLAAQDVQARLAGAPDPTLVLVRDAMTVPPFYAAPEMRLEDCVTLLLSAQLRCTVVLHNSKPIGIVRDADLFQAIESRS